MTFRTFFDLFFPLQIFNSIRFHRKIRFYSIFLSYNIATRWSHTVIIPVSTTRVLVNKYIYYTAAKYNYIGSLQILNPLVPSVLYIGRLAKFLISIMEGILKKISYERDYESVDEKKPILCYVTKKNPGTNGLIDIIE